MPPLVNKYATITNQDLIFTEPKWDIYKTKMLPTKMCHLLKAKMRQLSNKKATFTN